MLIQKNQLSGLILCSLIALVAMTLAPFLPLNALMVALLLGMALSALWQVPTTWRPGVIFSMKKVLRLAIILLGLRLSVAEVQQLGWSSVGLILLCVISTFGVTLLLGRWLKLSTPGSVLMASGISICGASAILAADAIVEAEESETVYAVATITLLGTVAMLSYPLLQNLLHLSELHYGLWVGSSVHEVAQVVAAGFAQGETTGELATITKLTRVLLLVPIMFALALYQRQKTRHQQSLQVPIPWFVFGFLGVMLIHPFLPTVLTQPLGLLGQFTLTLSMAALGLETRLDKLRAAGLRPLYLGVLSSLWISGLSLGTLYLLQP